MGVPSPIEGVTDLASQYPEEGTTTVSAGFGSEFLLNILFPYQGWLNLDMWADESTTIATNMLYNKTLLADGETLQKSVEKIFPVSSSNSKWLA